MSISSIQSYYFSILNHDIPYGSISKPDKHKENDIFTSYPLTNKSIVREWISLYIPQQKKKSSFIEGFMPRRKSSSSIAITSFDVMSIPTNKNKTKHHHQHPPTSTSLLLSDLLKNYNTRHYIEKEVPSKDTLVIDDFKIIEPYNPSSLYHYQSLKQESLSIIYTSRELRVNPDYLRMLVAEANMIRANKIIGSLRPRQYLPKRQDLICYSSTPLRQEL
ncbi:unnamed protein product [Cunninghamella echinulata]